MAINFSNPFTGVGTALVEGLLPRLGRQREQERMIESMNPLRELVLDQSRQSAFSGGPRGELPQGLPGAQQPMPGGFMSQVDTGRQPATPQPAQPQQPAGLQALPANLRPPPEIDSVLNQAAERHGVPVNALRALAAQESSFRPDVVGGTPIDLPGQEGDRAMGLFQFTPQEVAKMPGFNPNDPTQAADEAARRLKMRLDEGKPIDIAMMEHFGGPDPSLHGPRTRRYRQEITDKFQQLEQATGGGQQGQAQQPGLGQQMGQAGLAAGPFGSIIERDGPQQSPIQQMLASIAQDPQAFAQQFAGEGGIERITAMLQGGNGTQQTRVISGDTPEGRAMGIQPGERARVAGTVTSGGRFMPQEVKTDPFSGAADGGGPLITLMDMESGNVTTRRRDDPEVDQLINQGHVAASDGRALESLDNISGGERRQLRDAQVGTRTYIETVGDAIQMLNENPDINTFVARGAGLINDIRAEARAFAGAMGTEFDESVFDVTAHEDTFRELGIERERMQSMITSLAFQRAVAEKGGAGRITNRDIERFIAEIGGRSSDPQALAQVLQDTAERAARSFEINWETRMDSPFSGDLGLGRLPRYSPRTQFDNGAEGGGQDQQQMPSISSDAEYEQLPSGATFMAPDGTIRRKP